MASEIVPVIYLARHGETAWSVTGSAYRTYRFAFDGARRAQRRASWKTAGQSGFCQRADESVATRARTCELAGFGAVAKVDRDLVEWTFFKINFNCTINGIWR